MPGTSADSPRVALEAIKGEQTLAETGSRHGVHLTLVAAWNKAAIAGLAETFSAKAANPGSGVEAELAPLHAKIGQLVMARDLFAKASGR